jgi:hypothetical protein
VQLRTKWTLALLFTGALPLGLFAATTTRIQKRGLETAERHLEEAHERARGSVPYVDALCSGHRLWLEFQRRGRIGASSQLVQAATSAMGSFVGFGTSPGLLRAFPVLLATDA